MHMKLFTVTLITIISFSSQNGIWAGSMADYKISAATYMRAYDNRFEGEETMGWGKELSTAWARLGAAKTCGIPYDEKAALKKLNAINNVGNLTHKMNGIDFNASHSKRIDGFCTNVRKSEIKQFLKSF